VGGDDPTLEVRERRDHPPAGRRSGAAGMAAAAARPSGPVMPRPAPAWRQRLLDGFGDAQMAIG
jgi:hypothetical protein